MPGLFALHPLEEAGSVAGVIVASIITLTLFFRLLWWLGFGSEGDTQKVRFKELLDEETVVTIHLSTGITYENVRFLGFTSSDSFKSPPANELTGMAILGFPDGKRLLLQAKLIRMVEIPAVNPTSALESS